MIPKAELHVHLEGTAPPALIRRLAERNGMTVPEGVFKTEDEFEWTDFLHFLRTYDLAASAIRTPQDYRDVTYEYLSSCAAEGALYVELIASPDHAAAVGLSDADHYASIAQGIDDARADHGIEARIVLAAIRNLGVEAAEGIARRHADGRHPYVVGFNLVGDEAAWPAGLFARAYEIAAGSGLGCTVHAGEHAGPESVRAALELPITRISHGVRAIEDPALVAELAERGIVLEVCPTSNVSLGLFPSYEDHPLGALREAGVRVTLGSDDPPYFGCSIGSEYAVARERIGFDEEQLRDVTRIAVEASFAEDAVKEALSARLDFPEHRDSH
ncbi:MAG TPA: adenosine deaminase [Solirubrobacteraceae bacterium]